MKIDFLNTLGKIKPMHAINNAPILGADDRMFHYIGEAGFPFVRLHDTGGAYGNGIFVDIANIFRDFEADENDPKSYDFAFTDWLLNKIDSQNSKIFYRLGATIENYQRIKAYNIFPPKDNLKWAKIRERIISHYNEGWANGYELGIDYWEIWNEPDNFPDIADNCMWKGTFEEYEELYKITSVHLKKRFPNIKIGGYASCGFYNLFEKNYISDANSTSRTEYFIECFHKFMKFVKENELPLDFFSWHSYSDVKKNIAYEKYVHENLEKYGFLNTESILNEWNTGVLKRGTLEDSAKVAEMLLEMQRTTVDLLMYYDGQVHGAYQGLYNPIIYEPFKTYYVFKSFNELYKLGKCVDVADIPENISAQAATNGEKCALMLTNTGTKTRVKIETDFRGKYHVYRINDELNLELSEKEYHINELGLERFETVLITNYEI